MRAENKIHEIITTGVFPSMCSFLSAKIIPTAIITNQRLNSSNGWQWFRVPIVRIIVSSISRTFESTFNDYCLISKHGSCSGERFYTSPDLNNLAVANLRFYFPVCDLVGSQERVCRKMSN